MYLHKIKELNSSVWPIDETLTAITIPDQSRPGSNGNKEVHIFSRVPEL